MRLTLRELKSVIREAVSRAYPATASEYAKELNTKAAQRGGAYGELVDDQDYWSRVGINTGEELARSLATSQFSDAYKEAYGSRPRGVSLNDLSIEEIEDEIDQLYQYASEHGEGYYDLDAFDDLEISRLEDMSFGQEQDPFDEPDTEPDEYEHLPVQAPMGRRKRGWPSVSKREIGLRTGRGRIK